MPTRSRPLDRGTRSLGVAGGRGSSLRDLLRVAPGGPVDLAAIDPAGTPGLPDKKSKGWAGRRFAELGGQLAGYQERLYAQAKAGDATQRVLLVLQAMDCGGKDGATRKVAGTMNPQGLHIASFGQPTEEELRHDFLWRIRRELPAAGYVGVFNRSHYEDVLIVRVHGLVDEGTWRHRYDVINDFERELTDGQTTLVKVMLHISYGEQTRRLRERLDDPTKHWKYNPADVDERAHWREYQRAYQDALDRCSTPYAPWYVIPADHKWYRDWALATLLVETFGELSPEYPPGAFDLAVERARLDASVRLPADEHHVNGS